MTDAGDDGTGVAPGTEVDGIGVCLASAAEADGASVRSYQPELVVGLAQGPFPVSAMLLRFPGSRSPWRLAPGVGQRPPPALPWM